MCNSWCYDFVTESQRWWPKRPTILEVGSLNVNGSPRDVCRDLPYASYYGVDLVAGPGVDEIVDVVDLPTKLQQRFDVVISTEMLEHVHDWKKALYALIEMVKENGVLVLTTRSPGFEYHPFPEDNWRFRADDFCGIFALDIGFEPFELALVSLDSDKRNGVSCGIGICVIRKRGNMKILQERLDVREMFNVHIGKVGPLE